METRIFPALIHLKLPVPKTFLDPSSKVAFVGGVSLHISKNRRYFWGASMGTLRKTCVISCLETFFKDLAIFGCDPYGAIVFSVFGAVVQNGKTTAFSIGFPFRELRDGFHSKNSKCNPIVYKRNGRTTKIITKNKDPEVVLAAVTIEVPTLRIIDSKLPWGLSKEMASFLAPENLCILEKFE